MWNSQVSLFAFWNESSHSHQLVLWWTPSFFPVFTCFLVLQVSFLCWLSHKLFLYQRWYIAVFSFFLNLSKFIFDIAPIVLFCFLKSNCHLFSSPFPGTKPVSCLSSFEIFYRVCLLELLVCSSFHLLGFFFPLVYQRC